MANKHVIQEFFEDTSEDFELRKYSGRGMYGKECVGIITPSLAKFMAHVMQSLQYKLDSLEFDPDSTDEVVGNLAQAFKHMRTDSMGLDTIVYFPNMEFVGEEFSNGDEGEDEA